MEMNLGLALCTTWSSRSVRMAYRNTARVERISEHSCAFLRFATRKRAPLAAPYRNRRPRRTWSSMAGRNAGAPPLTDDASAAATTAGENSTPRTAPLPLVCSPRPYHPPTPTKAGGLTARPKGRSHPRRAGRARSPLRRAADRGRPTPPRPAVLRGRVHLPRSARPERAVPRTDLGARGAGRWGRYILQAGPKGEPQHGNLAETDGHAVISGAAPPPHDPPPQKKHSNLIHVRTSPP